MREFKVELLDLVHEQSTDPVPDLDEVKELVESFTQKREVDIGEKEKQAR